MGGRGSSFGGGGSAEIKTAENIKKEMLNIGLNSNIPGIRKKAQEGTGNYSYKDAKAVTAKDFEPVAKLSLVHERNGNTLIEGYLGDKHVFYANKSDSPEIKNLLSKRPKGSVDTDFSKSLQGQGTAGAGTTTTYERWYRRNQRKFNDYYFGNGKNSELAKFLFGTDSAGEANSSKKKKKK